MFGGGIVDTVSYEGDVAGFVEGSGSGLEDDSNIDNSGISRFPDGVDTDMNNVDLSPRCVTPGEANSADTFSCATPGPPVLVINEIDYDQPSSDFAEFVEIFNDGNGAADLTGVTLELVNGSDNLPYDTVALPSVTLLSGEYYVVCADALSVPNCDLEGFSSIQNGAPDAVALMFDGAIVDTVSYEGDVTGFVEGSGSGLEDSGSTGEEQQGHLEGAERRRHRHEQRRPDVCLRHAGQRQHFADHRLLGYGPRLRDLRDPGQRCRDSVRRPVGDH